MRPRHLVVHRLVPLLLALSACAPELYSPDGDEDSEGELYDEVHPNSDLQGANGLGYERPDVEALPHPEIVVSLAGLTVHLFDRSTGFSAVYPAGPGVLSAKTGRSITPTGHFRTSADVGDRWYYTPARWFPAYFDGLPFLRIDAKNSDGQATYGLHGPITSTLIRGYVSHGCVRMAADDVVDLFWMIKDHPRTPVTIQQEVELDALGEPVDVGTTPALYEVGDAIRFGASVGPRPGT
jgi:hypothetical protein